MNRSIDVAALRPQFRGELITPADGERYARAQNVFNATYSDRRPALIARPTGVADIQVLLRLCHEENLRVAVRAGGHSVAGYSTVQDGVVIDLGALKGIRVDPVRRRARAQGGVTWADFDRETQAFGLATTGGRVTTTGLAGLTLGSGSGWLERMCGLTCDNLVSADVVTASGELVIASEKENPELLWGLRGGGGNFGIVTELEYQLHPVGPVILGGMLLYPRAEAQKILRSYRDFMRDAPRELGGALAFLTAPPAPFVPAGLQNQPAVALVFAWFGEARKGEKVLASIRGFGAPAVELVQPMPYVALQGMLDAGLAHGNRNYWKSENLRALPDEAIDTLVARAQGATSPLSQVIVMPLGGAIADRSEDATALGGRSAAWQYHCYGIWPPGDDASHVSWVKETEQAMRPFTAGGISLNFVSDAGNDRVRAAFGEAKYRRLVALKDRYDPENLFSLNQNVLPSPRA